MIQLNPHDADAHNNRRCAYESKKDYDRAIADFDCAFQIRPNYELALENRKVALKEDGFGNDGKI